MVPHGRRISSALTPARSCSPLAPGRSQFALRHARVARLPVAAGVRLRRTRRSRPRRCPLLCPGPPPLCPTPWHPRRAGSGGPSTARSARGTPPPKSLHVHRRRGGSLFSGVGPPHPSQPDPRQAGRGPSGPQAVGVSTAGISEILRKDESDGEHRYADLVGEQLEVAAVPRRNGGAEQGLLCRI